MNKNILLTLFILGIAIWKEMCYTISVIKESGMAYPLLYLYRNAGIIIGAIIFMFLTVSAAPPLTLESAW